MPIQKPQIPPRQRIPVSPERRDQARAGMGGEQLKATGATAPAADSAPAPVEAPAPPVATVPAEPMPAPTAPPETLAVATEPEPAPAPDSAIPPGLVAPAAQPVAAAPSAAPTAGRRRGRKPAAPDAVLMETERSVKIPESVWNDIRLALVLLPKGENLPTSIKSYLVAAHRAYEAQLRKQGKLPAAK